MRKQKIVKTEDGARLYVRMSESDKNKIFQLADRHNMSMSEYVRECALNGVVVYYDVDAIYTLATVISRIGVNIHQVAKVANSTRSIHSNNLKALLREHSRVTFEVSESLSPEGIRKNLRLFINSEEYELVPINRKDD